MIFFILFFFIFFVFVGVLVLTYCFEAVLDNFVTAPLFSSVKLFQK